MKRNYMVGYKVFFGLLGFSAVVTEIATIVAGGNWNPANFFSYFTIESNILAVVTFLLSALFLFAGKKSKSLDFFRGATTFFMVVTGIVFAVLLSGIEGIVLTAAPWDNIVLHYLIPIAIVIDWIVDGPSAKLSYRKTLIWLVFPVTYVVYSLIRGPIVNWYPYPFLNPANGGYGQVLVTSIIIMVGGVILAYIVSRIGSPVHTVTSRKK